MTMTIGAYLSSIPRSRLSERWFTSEINLVESRGRKVSTQWVVYSADHISNREKSVDMPVEQRVLDRENKKSV